MVNRRSLRRRPKAAWAQTGLPLSSASNDACKLYDATLTQYVGWYDDDSVGGIETSVEKMIQADPDFVMGHVLSTGLELMGTGRSTRLDKKFQADIDRMVELAKSPKVSEREKRHSDAIQLWADGNYTKACDVWEGILVDFPTDITALKFAHDAYFYLGMHPQLRDSPGRILSLWKPDLPLYGYVIGMHSFGLEETNLYDQAEKAALKSLRINRRDAWATHTMCHVMEMMGRQDEGIAFLSKTIGDWTTCGHNSCHNFWHWAVYHIEKGEYQGALDIFDGQLSAHCMKSRTMLDIVDTTSMLYRLELEGVNVGERWNDIYDVCRPHIDDHILAFNDAHILMSCLGAKQKETAQKMMESIEEYVRNGSGTNQEVMRLVGQHICQAFVAYDDGDYAKAADLLYDIRYEVIKIGGSHAQRDVFNLFLIHSCMKSPKVEHHRKARHLLMERKALKDKAPMTDRLIERAMALHCD